MPHPATWAAVLAVGLLSTAFAYVLYFRILATAGATNLLLVTFLIPVSAILLGVLVLNETLLLRHVAGMALIGGGLACIDGRLPRWFVRSWRKVAGNV
jgi:drug/metabolite transporter (DMT)-like permease